MGVLDGVRVILYRCHEKGLEILLINNDDMSDDPNIWRLPNADVDDERYAYIELEDTLDSDGNMIKTMAIEADWHDVPSIRGMIKYDVNRVKSKIKKTLPSFEKGTYFTIKEAIKKSLPQEYAAMKELKDIIVDRNMVTNI